jgi:hypothetical protein
MGKQQRLASRLERELLRAKGQFWTPDWVAEVMVAYVLGKGARQLFDPAVGTGAFFRAAKKLASCSRRVPQFVGCEIDPTVLRAAVENGFSHAELSQVQVRDFVLDPPAGPFEAIVANPPYLRHHRLSAEVKAKLRSFAYQILGQPIDGRAGLHVYFLLRALQLLARGGRLAFIMPADTCEGVFAPVLWSWITRHYRLDAVITFDPAATPFPEVDTNPLIFFIEHTEPRDQFYWVRCEQGGGKELYQWVMTGFQCPPSGALCVYQRTLDEALRVGLSRPALGDQDGGCRLGDLAIVVRGIATGANDFFFLTHAQVKKLDIPREFLVRAIGRTRDVPGDRVDSQLLHQLERLGRPTWLFCPDGRPLQEFPDSVRRYLLEGAAQGLPRRPLLATRQPWYKMERRHPPPFLFAYLGRRNARFIRNLARVVPLTGFLCVYPRHAAPEFLERLWTVLNHPETLRNLPLVGKSYGAGCIKVEPRALEQLPLSEDVVRQAKLAEFVRKSRAGVQLVIGW